MAMRRWGIIGLTLLTVALAGKPAHAQLVSLADDIIFLSRGASKNDQARRDNALGRTPGTTAVPFRFNPGGRRNPLEETVDPAQSKVSLGGGRRSALGAFSAPTRHIAPRTGLAPPRPAAPSGRTNSSPTLYGMFELPHDEYEGPPGGMTLDQAIDRLARENLELRSKFLEIPQARADVLTAGMRANPFYFLSASSYPYAPYSQSRPGENQYSVSVIQPVDINRKREARLAAAAGAVRVREAQYQNAVRLAIDDLYEAFVETIVARQAVRYAELTLAGAARSFETAQRQRQGGRITEAELLEVFVEQRSARLAAEQAHSQLSAAKHRLAVLLNLPADAAARLELRGRMADQAPTPAGRDVLTQLALTNRPDLTAFRLGIARAQADVRVARRERIDDLFVVYSPYEVRNNHPTGGQNATSFSLGLMSSIPIIDRNQGEIRRAELNVQQTRIALAARQREVVEEVERAAGEYFESRRSVAEFARTILPASERMRAIAYQSYQNDESRIKEFMEAQQKHNGLVRQYRDAVIRHRLAMLRLNTVVAQRIFP
jgi:outer membrane protein, heavy metal efflux system